MKKPSSREEFLREGSKRGPGKYTAKETGAYWLAHQREAARQKKKLYDAAQSQESFEDMIKGKGVKD